MLPTKKIASVALALTALGGLGTAHAANNQERGGDQAARTQELSTLAASNTSLSQAIAAAEQQSGGKAIDAGLEKGNGATAIAVRIAKGNSVQKVVVDPQSGKVLQVVAENVDQGDGDGEENDE